MIVDTDVLIWYMRGNPKARQVLQGKSFCLSVVSYMELVQGMRNKRELAQFRKALGAWDCTVLYITQEISVKAMFAVERHFLSHALQLGDALIGATAIEYDFPILTANDKHYQAMHGIRLKKFRP